MATPYNSFPNYKRRYDYSLADNLRDLFPDEFLETIPWGVKKKTGYRSKHLRAWVHSVFMDFVDIIQRDMVATGDKFIWPVRPFANTYIREIDAADALRKIITPGVYDDVNPILSKGKIYEMVYYSVVLKHRVKNKRGVRIGYKLYKEIVQRVNNGQVYWAR